MRSFLTLHAITERGIRGLPPFLIVDIKKSKGNIMKNTHLICIDPQNDFTGKNGRRIGKLYVEGKLIW